MHSNNFLNLSELLQWVSQWAGSWSFRFARKVSQSIQRFVSEWSSNCGRICWFGFVWDDLWFSYLIKISACFGRHSRDMSANWMRTSTSCSSQFARTRKAKIGSQKRDDECKTCNSQPTLTATQLDRLWGRPLKLPDRHFLPVVCVWGEFEINNSTFKQQQQQQVFGSTFEAHPRRKRF